MSVYRKIYPVSHAEVLNRHIVLDDCETCDYPGGAGRVHDLTVKRHLGSGVYGSVFLATDNHTGKEYAVKVFYVPNDEHYDTATDPLLYEALGHSRASENVEGVVKFHGVIHDAGSPYFFFVMDYHPGGDLYSLMDAHSSIFYRRDWLVTSLAIQVVEALIECHSLGIYHRDLKSDNILISKDRTKVWISDFGLCTENKWSRPWGRGYSAYMSPESAGAYPNLERYNNKLSDLYSLGVLLTQLVTGHTPWTRPNEQDVYYTYFLSSRADFFTHVFPLSAEAGQLLAGLVDPDPTKRTRLPQLLNQLRSLERWYMTEDELAHARPELREFDAARCERGAVGALLTPPQTPTEEEESASPCESCRPMRTEPTKAAQVWLMLTLRDSDDEDSDEEEEASSLKMMTKAASTCAKDVRSTA